MIEFVIKKYQQLLNQLRAVCQKNLILTSNIAETLNLKRGQITITCAKYSKIWCIREDMIMITNTIGFSRRLDNVFLKKIWLVHSKPSKPCKVKRIIPKETEKHLSKREKRIELILAHRWLTVALVKIKMLHKKGKHLRQREDLLEEVWVHHHQLTAEIPKVDGQKVNYL